MTYTKENQEKGAKLMRTLVEKAWESAAFKDQLLNDPASAIQNVTGKKLTMPEHKRLVVEDQTNESIIFLNIPAKPNFDEMELSDEQLDHVAGGEIGLFIAGLTLGIAIYAATHQY